MFALLNTSLSVSFTDVSFGMISDEIIVVISPFLYAAMPPPFLYAVVTFTSGDRNCFLMFACLYFFV